MLASRQIAIRHVARTAVRGSLTRTSIRNATTAPRVKAPRRTGARPPPASSNVSSAAAGISAMPSSQRYALYGALGVVMLASMYMAQLGVALTKASDKTVYNLSAQNDVAARYDEIAGSFDSDVNASEWLMGILSLRKLLANMCHGNVLEVSCGTGRNLGYFDLEASNSKSLEKKNHSAGVTSLTFIDLSEQMVQVCRRKWAALHGIKSVQTGLYNNTPVRFLIGSALDVMPLAPSGAKYDTILQTMGLCSMPEPESLLRNLVQHLNYADNPHSRILLLEHGRSNKDWLNRVLDNTAEKHAEAFGCWYNRDIDAIVQRAADQAGLEVVDMKRKHWGTTFVYELRAGEKLAGKRVPEIEEEEHHQQETQAYGMLGVAQQAWKQLSGK